MESQVSSIVPAAEETGSSIALSETLKTGFSQRGPSNNIIEPGQEKTNILLCSLPKGWGTYFFSSPEPLAQGELL